MNQGEKGKGELQFVCLIGGGGFVTRGSSMLWTSAYSRL